MIAVNKGVLSKAHCNCQTQARQSAYHVGKAMSPAESIAEFEHLLRMLRHSQQASLENKFLPNTTSANAELFSGCDHFVSHLGDCGYHRYHRHLYHCHYDSVTCSIGSQVELGQAKVAQLDVTLGVIKDVVWLEISVDDALGVNMGQTCQRLPDHLHSIITSSCSK